MKGIVGISSMVCLALLAVGTACSKSSQKKGVAEAAQDTMLLRDLAEANKNTAQAEAPDNRSSEASLPQPAPTKRMSPPMRANDAPVPINVPARMQSPAGSQSSASGDPCDSPAPADQRTCLNRSIVVNDAELNRVYRDLIAQSRLSGGPDLEQRFRQAQREWVDRRDTECRQQTDGPEGGLWARARARCLADFSARRATELQRSLNGLRGQ